jgi:hypothetical protein
MSRARRLAANLFLSIGSLAVFLVVVELVLQFVVPLVYRPRLTKLDPELGWYHRSSVEAANTLEGHTYRESYNGHGYRWPEHDYRKAEGTRRIAVLGDSFVNASEVGDEETFTWHLQTRLSGVEVINLGVYGYSTAQQLITLERVAFRFHPDLVVLVTLPNDYPGNNLTFNYFGPAPRFVLDGDSLRLEATNSPAARAAFRATNLPLPGMAFLHRHSLVYYFLNHSIYQRLIAARIDSVFASQREALSRPDSIELYRRLVARMKKLCDDRGVDFLVVFAYERSELRERRPSPSARVQAVLQGDGVATLDLYPALRDAELGGGPTLYYREDIHWNTRGHRMVADLLRPHLERWLAAQEAGPGDSTPRP